MHLPCKQAYVGALPTDSTSLRQKAASPERREEVYIAALFGSADHFELRGTRLKHRAKPHKLRQAGVIPAPATISGK
jgi:hypothetical protein